MILLTELHINTDQRISKITIASITYRKISNIRRTKSQNLSASRLIL